MTVREDLRSLRTNYKIIIAKDDRLQVPFPSLNKLLPMNVPVAINATPVVVQETNHLVDTQTHSESCVSTDLVVERDVRISQLEAIDWEDLAEKFLDVLEEAVSIRVHNAPLLSPSVTSEIEPLSKEMCSDMTLVRGDSGQVDTTGSSGTRVVVGQAKVAVLYSGGVDSAVLAALVDRYVC